MSKGQNRLPTKIKNVDLKWTFDLLKMDIIIMALEQTTWQICQINSAAVAGYMTWPPDAPD